MSQVVKKRKLLKRMVDLEGFEPSTSSMPWKRAPNCATGPLGIFSPEYHGQRICKNRCCSASVPTPPYVRRSISDFGSGVFLNLYDLSPQDVKRAGVAGSPWAENGFRRDRYRITPPSMSNN